MRIILASASPRRKEILSQLGIKFEVFAPETDESSDTHDPAKLVRELALRKGRAAKEKLGQAGGKTADMLIISADTVVYCDGKILGKPENRRDAREMIMTLAGREHSVFSGIAVMYGGREAADISQTEVLFTPISNEAAEGYLNTGEYIGKAGAYAVQGLAALFIKEIRGDYLTVVGMSVSKLSELLQREFGISMPALSGLVPD